MVAQYADWFAKGDVESVNKLKNGHDVIISSGLKKFAAYRDEKNQLHVFNAMCIHLGCVVQWDARKNFRLSLS